MRNQPEVQTAARIARLFRIDPAIVLQEENRITHAARIAAYQIVADDEAAAASKARSR